MVCSASSIHLRNEKRFIVNFRGLAVRGFKIIGIVLIAYLGVVVLFESALGYFQPQGDDTLILPVKGDEGPSLRVLSRIEVDDQLYVAVNHWPRGWFNFNKVLENPEVKITIGDETAEYRAVKVTAVDEAARIDSARPRSLLFLLLTGFPPRKFVRLEG